MNISESSTSNRVYLRVSALVLFVICLPGLAHAQWASDGSGNINSTNSGNVGIGTTGVPGEKLEVSGSGSTYVKVVSTNGQAGIKFFQGTNSSQIFADVNHNFWFYDTSRGASRMVIDTSGNVGIGTTSPQARLDVSGAAAIVGNITQYWGDHTNYVQFPTAYTTSPTYYMGWRTAADSRRLFIDNIDGDGSAADPNGGITFRTGVVPTDRLHVAFNGNVGIGTANPGAKLSVIGDGAGRMLSGPSGFGGNYTGISLNSALDTSNYNLLSSSTDKTLYVNSPDQIQFRINNATKIFLDAGGNVGIGTTNPVHTLEVAGTIHATQAITGLTINATYQDVAEWVPSSQKLPAGTVVVLDTAKSNHVLASSSSYDTKVAGVISAKPGIALGTSGEGKLLVATTGRVKVKVDATTAPIHVGDLLVTSDNEGVAMKSEPILIGGRKLHAPGTIVGKALEPLEKGTGEILVLLSLQ